MEVAVTSESSRRAWIAEHDAIYRVLMKTSRAVGRLNPSSNPRRVGKLAEEIQTLRERMRSHFESEERDGGLFERLQDLLPADSRRLEKLRKEHTTLCSRVGAVVELLRGGTLPSPGSIATELEGIVKLLLEHEAVEEQLAHRGLNWSR